MINKGRRHELKMLKYKKRINQLSIDETKGKFYGYRSHGQPCSCYMCSPTKFKREQKRPLHLIIEDEANINTTNSPR